MVQQLLRRSAPVSITIIITLNLHIVQNPCNISPPNDDDIYIWHRECSSLIAGFHQKAATGKLTGAHRKYSTSKFGYAAKCEPAKFLLETILPSK